MARGGRAQRRRTGSWVRAVAGIAGIVAASVAMAAWTLGLSAVEALARLLVFVGLWLPVRRLVLDRYIGADRGGG